MLTPLSVPLTREPAAGELEVVDVGLEQVRRDGLAFSMTLSAARTTASPPTTSDREP